MIEVAKKIWIASEMRWLPLDGRSEISGHQRGSV